MTLRCFECRGMRSTEIEVFITASEVTTLWRYRNECIIIIIIIIIITFTSIHGGKWQIKLATGACQEVSHEVQDTFLVSSSFNIFDFWHVAYC